MLVRFENWGSDCYDLVSNKTLFVAVTLVCLFEDFRQYKY